MYFRKQLNLNNNIDTTPDNYFKYSDAKNIKLIYFSLFVLLLSVARGLVPLLTRDGSFALPTYYFSFLLGLLLASYGFYKACFSNENIITKKIKYLLVLNLIFTLYHILPLLILLSSMKIILSMVNLLWFPFAVYAFIKIPEKKLIFVFKVITLIVAGFVIYDFISINTMIIPNGIESTNARYKLLRPDYVLFSYSGMYGRPNGILGEGYLPHDSANLLALFSVFWLSLSFRTVKGHFIIIFLSIISIIALLLTQSASNIIAGVVGLFIVLFTYKNKIFTLKNLFIIILLPMPLYLWLLDKYVYYFKFLSAWFARVDPSYNAMWKAMFYFGSLGDSGRGYSAIKHTSSSVLADIISFLFGYSISLKISDVGLWTELAFIKILFEYGFIHAIIIFLLLSMPCILYIFKKHHFNKFDIFPYVITIFVALLTLWHYGSILRTTNIFVFLAVYGQFIRVYVNSKAYNYYL